MEGRDATLVAGVIILAVLLLALLGGGMMMGPGMMGWAWGGYGFSPWGGILMLVFWALIVGGIAFLGVWLFRQWSPAGPGAGAGGARALDILRERYARGEITREEYEQMRHDLEER